MPGRGGQRYDRSDSEPSVQGFSFLRAAPASPLWTTDIRLLREPWLSLVKKLQEGVTLLRWSRDGIAARELVVRRRW